MNRSCQAAIAAALPATIAILPSGALAQGTVTGTEDLDKALDAGSEFIVSPGLTERLGQAAVDKGVPFLPGVASAGDIMRGLDLGLTRFILCVGGSWIAPKGAGRTQIEILSRQAAALGR